MSDEKKPSDPVDEWPATTIRMRVEACRLQLYALGLLTESDNAAVWRRTQDWVERTTRPTHGTEGKP